MTSQEDTCQRVQSFLKTKFQVSSVPFPWIEGCVTWFRNINPNTSNFQVLFDFVAQQWLLADFQQLKIKSLPANLKNSPVVKLDENYLLQVRRFEFPSDRFSMVTFLFTCLGRLHHQCRAFSVLAASEDQQGTGK